MRPGFSLNLIYTLAVLSIGVSAGWWLRAEVYEEIPSATRGELPGDSWALQEWSNPADTAPQSTTPSLARNPVTERHGSGSPRSGSQGSGNQGYGNQGSGSQSFEKLGIENNDTGSQDSETPDRVTEFRELLSDQSYSAAMDIYREVERRSSRQTAELKALVLDYLESYLESGDDGALTSLVDAFLSDYYDDIDVLLVLARHQFQSDYFSESARTFQLAFSYSLTQAGGQQQVGQAFQQFVADVDHHLDITGQWQELTRFYESLQQLGLTEPDYQLRLAQLYLDHGEPTYGYDLLHRLKTNPTVAAEATAMLNDEDGAARNRTTDRRSQPAQAIALDIIGSHYHLPLRLNNSLDISLLIDTGASVTTLSRERFNAIRNGLELTELGPQIFNTAGGTAKGTMYQAESVQLGRHILNDVHIAVLDFNMPEGVDGLLGMNVLRHFRFEVDQDRHELQLQPRP